MRTNCLLRIYLLGSLPGIETKKMFQLYGKALDVARTAVHYFMFTILGLMMSIPGPTLIDLKHSSNTHSHNISFLFTARSIGFLFGSLTGGCILDYIKNEEIALITSSLVVAIGAFTIPWCRSLTVLLGTFIITGFAMGFSNTGSNAGCLRIWGKKGAPYIQALHFFYGLGGFLAPLLAAPFLSTQLPIPADLTQNFTTEIISETPNTTDPGLQIIVSEKITIPTITFAYSIIGVLTLLVCGCFVFVFVFSSSEKNIAEKNVQVQTKDRGLTFTVVVVILACLQTGLISGVEVSFAQMLTSYAVKSSHNLNKVTGSYMTSVYWASFTITRAFSIALAYKVNVRNLLIFDFILSVTASIMLLAVGTWSEYALWTGTALLGVGVASVFPASLSWIEKYININNRIASSFNFISSVLEMTVPYTISIYLGSQPNILFQFMTVATIACCALFTALNIILTRKGEKYVQEETPKTEKEKPKEMSEELPKTEKMPMKQTTAL